MSLHRWLDSRVTPTVIAPILEGRVRISDADLALAAPGKLCPRHQREQSTRRVQLALDRHLDDVAQETLAILDGKRLHLTTRSRWLTAIAREL